MREIVGSETPRILASTVFLMPRRCAARSVALVITLDSSGTAVWRGLTGILIFCLGHECGNCSITLFLWKEIPFLQRKISVLISLQFYFVLSIEILLTIVSV